jgi:hypothetical protein
MTGVITVLANLPSIRHDEISISAAHPRSTVLDVETLTLDCRAGEFDDRFSGSWPPCAPVAEKQS